MTTALTAAQAAWDNAADEVGEARSDYDDAIGEVRTNAANEARAAFENAARTDDESGVVTGAVSTILAAPDSSDCHSLAERIVRLICATTADPPYHLSERTHAQLLRGLIYSAHYTAAEEAAATEFEARNRRP